MVVINADFGPVIIDNFEYVNLEHYLLHQLSLDFFNSNKDSNENKIKQILDINDNDKITNLLFTCNFNGPFYNIIENLLHHRLYEVYSETAPEKLEWLASTGNTQIYYNSNFIKLGVSEYWLSLKRKSLSTYSAGSNMLSKTFAKLRLLCQYKPEQSKHYYVNGRHYSVPAIVNLSYNAAVKAGLHDNIVTSDDCKTYLAITNKEDLITFFTFINKYKLTN